MNNMNKMNEMAYDMMMMMMIMYYISRYLFVGVNCIDGKINIINDDDDDKNENEKQREKEFVIIGLNNSNDGIKQVSRLFGYRLLLCVGVFFAMILSLILYKKYIVKYNKDNQYKRIDDPRITIVK